MGDCRKRRRHSEIKGYHRLSRKIQQSHHYGAATYVKNLEYDKKTGAVIQDRQGLYLDEKSLREEEKYDGYYMLLTSELDMSEEEIVDVYTGLWEIENSFRLINSTFHARPDYVSRADHMYTHFSTCFVALTLTRLLELKTQRKYPLQQVIRSLKNAAAYISRIITTSLRIMMTFWNLSATAWV